MISPISYQQTDADPVRTFDEVSALVRLAHKYHVQPVQDQALAALRVFDFTDDFDTYDDGLTNNVESLISKDAQAIGAVNLARLTDTPSMLPLAMYQCAYLTSALLDGWKRRDGTVEELSRADLRRCIDGRIALAQEQRILLYQVFSEDPSDDCARPGSCSDILRAMQNIFVLSRDCTDCMVLTDCTDGVDKIGLCSACREEVRDRSRRGRRVIWNKLPEIFNLDVEG